MELSEDYCAALWVLFYVKQMRLSRYLDQEQINNLRRKWVPMNRSIFEAAQELFENEES